MTKCVFGVFQNLLDGEWNVDDNPNSQNAK